MKRNTLKIVLISKTLDRLFVLDSGKVENIAKILTPKAIETYSTMTGKESVDFIARHDPALVEIIENMGDDAVKNGFHVFVNEWIETFRYIIQKLVTCDGRNISWTEVIISPETIKDSWTDIRDDPFSRRAPLCHFSEIKEFLKKEEIKRS